MEYLKLLLIFKKSNVFNLLFLEYHKITSEILVFWICILYSMYLRSVNDQLLMANTSGGFTEVPAPGLLGQVTLDGRHRLWAIWKVHLPYSWELSLCFVIKTNERSPWGWTRPTPPDTAPRPTNGPPCCRTARPVKHAFRLSECFKRITCDHNQSPCYKFYLNHANHAGNYNFTGHQLSH